MHPSCGKPAGHARKSWIGGEEGVAADAQTVRHSDSRTLRHSDIQTLGRELVLKSLTV